MLVLIDKEHKVVNGKLFMFKGKLALHGTVDGFVGKILRIGRDFEVVGV